MSLQVNQSNFEEEVLKASGPVLVDFWAEWCGPCRIMGPIVDEIGAEFGEKLKVVKVNVDEAGELAQKYDVMSIPSFKIFKGGEVVKEFVGSKSKEDVLKLLADFIA